MATTEACAEQAVSLQHDVKETTNDLRTTP